MSLLRILLVEDEPDIREIIELSLSLDAELQTQSCTSGREALALAAEWAPDLILLDVMMPAMDGPTTLAHLRKDTRTERIPVVFMTARAQAREIALFRSLGAAGVIAKPFDPMTLAGLVRSHMQSAAERFAVLRSNFIARLREDSDVLRRHKSLTIDLLESERLTRIGEVAHSLAGAGGIYGFAQISDAAAALEDALLDEAEPNAPQIVKALEQLLACLNAASAPGAVPPLLEFLHED